ncbi:MAG: ABC transporter ATP-binding protein [Acutalibacteraceae bacterium]|jgi:iron complex transport system ATP-binding protein
MMLTFSGICCGYDRVPVLRDISFSAEPGLLTGLVGTNGCGKTTLLKTAAGLLAPCGGEILLDGQPVSALTRREFARQVSYLPQNRPVPEISVELLAEHGRFPHLGFSRTLTAADRAAVERALLLSGTEGLRPRNVAHLSGGERQRAYLAMLLAQDTDVLLLDEPTAFLDISQQFSLLELLQKLALQGKTIVVVLHELALAMKFCSRLAVLESGRLAGFGTPEELWRQRIIDRAFGVVSRRVENDGDVDFLFLPKK